MEISEKKIEDLIVECISNGRLDKLRDRGLEDIYHYDRFYRQFNLGGYGRLDLVGMRYRHEPNSYGCEKYLDILLIEVKKGEINVQTFLQSLRYCKGIEVLLRKYNLKPNIEICLIGTSVCNDDFVYASDFISNLSIYTLNLCLDNGISFKKESNYSLIGEKSPIVSEATTADITKYIRDKVKSSRINYLPF